MLCPLQTRDNELRHRKGIQRRKRTPFAGIVSRDEDQRLGTLPACDCTHFPNIRRKCRPAHAANQKQQRGTPNHPEQPQPTRALTSCVVSMAKRSATATATRRKVSFSHVRMKAHNATPRSSNSSL